VKCLLDTSIFLWMIGQPEKLNAKALRLLSTGKAELYLSAASSWELVIKAGTGRLTVDEPLADYVPRWQSRFGIIALNILQVHALAVAALPAYHRDPFDRILVAQAQIEEMVLLTSDRALAQYPVKSLWCGK
jgi:PIN domain nuclease of toxin-antitoxin system